MVGEHERAAGAWHSEWEPSLTPSPWQVEPPPRSGGAEGLEVYPEKMLENLNATGGLLLAENVATGAAEHLGRLEAHDLVEEASHRALEAESLYARSYYPNPDSARFSPRRDRRGWIRHTPRVCRGVRGPGSETIS